MGWIWSDELAATLRESSDLAPLIPGSWEARPTAFAILDGEHRVQAGMRLLGLPQPAVVPVTSCTCDRRLDA